MGIVSRSIVVPANPGPGAGVLVDDLAGMRTIVLAAGTTDGVQLETSGDDVDAHYVPVSMLKFAGSDVRATRLDTPWIRARRLTGSSGTFVLSLSAEQLATAGGSAEYTAGPEGSAGATQPEVPFYQLRGGKTVRRVLLVPQENVAGDATDYATVSVLARKGSDGSLIGTVASLTSVTAWTQRVQQPATLGAAVNLSDGDYLSYTVAKAGSGRQLPLFGLFVGFGP
jgi:hypothetical protein